MTMEGLTSYKAGRWKGSKNKMRKELIFGERTLVEVKTENFVLSSQTGKLYLVIKNMLKSAYNAKLAYLIF